MTGSGDAKSTDRTGDAPRPFTDLTNLRPPMSPTKLRYDEDQPSFQMSPATEPPASPLLNTTGPPSRDSGAGSVPGTPTSVRARVHPYQREVRCNSSTDVNLVRFARQQQQQQMPSMSRSLPGRSKLVPAQSQSLTPTYFATAPMDLDGSSSSRDRCNSDLGHTIRPPPHSSHSSSPIGMCNSGMEGASRNSVGSDEVFTENVMLPVACADDECESQHSSNSGSTRRSRSNTYGSDGRSRVPNTPLRQHTPLTPKQSQADFSGRRSVCGTPSLDGDSNDPTGPVFRTVEDDCSLADIFDGDDAMSAWHSDDCLQEQQQLNFQQQMQSRHGVFPQHHSYDSLSSLSRSDSLTTNFAAMSTVTPSQTPTPTRDMAKEQAMAAAISAPPSKLTSSPKLPRALIRSQTLHGRPSSPLTSVVEDTSMSMGAGRPARSYRSQECVASPSSSFADSSFVGSKWSSHVLPMPVQELQQHQQGSMLEEEESSTSTPARTTTAATATAAIIARIAKTETAGTVERTEDYGVTPLHHSPDIVAVPVPRCRRVQSCMFSSPATLFRAVSPTPNFTFGTFNAFNPSAPQPPAKAAMTPRDGSRTASEVYGSQSTLTGADCYDGLRHPGASSSAIQHMLTLRARASSMCEIGPTHEPIPHLLETVDEPQYSHNVDRTISPFTVHELIGGVHSDKFDYYVILDARFEYEFNGGHIANALNKYDPVECKAFVFGELLDYLKKENIDTLRCCIVIHCEFSHSRAPKMFDMLRQEDRNRNAAHYPLLTFPQMFLINTGYKGMFTEYPADCTPQSYLAMDDPAYTAERNACLDRWKSDTSKPKKRSRSQSCVYSHY